MDLEQNRLIKCKGCSKEFPINAIRSHLGKKPSCKKEYSQEESSELNEICSVHQNQKKRAARKSLNKSEIMEILDELEKLEKKKATEPLDGGGKNEQKEKKKKKEERRKKKNKVKNEKTNPKNPIKNQIFL